MKAYYINNHSILVINPNGKMRTLYTPFRVLNPIDGSWVYVQEVASGPKDELLFIVNGHAHPHSHFHIRIRF